jgi:hypothetical protein
VPSMPQLSDTPRRIRQKIFLIAMNNSGKLP